MLGSPILGRPPLPGPDGQSGGQMVSPPSAVVNVTRAARGRGERPLGLVMVAKAGPRAALGSSS